MKLARWRQRAKDLSSEVRVLYLALKDPRTPWYAKVSAAIVVGYAFSPIDLIPDPIPILGHLDDLILIPLGVAVTLKMIPSAVLAESRSKVQAIPQEGRRVNWIATGVIVALWLLLIALAVRFLVQTVKG